MTHSLPVPPALPHAADALARVPLGADLVEQTPPAPLSISNDLASRIDRRYHRANRRSQWRRRPPG